MKAQEALDPICKSSGVCERDSLTTSRALAALVFVYIHILQAELVSSTEHELLSDLFEQAGCILLHIQYL